MTQTFSFSEPCSPCETCGFHLYLPIQKLQSSSIGLYDDANFPGRCIVTLDQHFDHLEDVPFDLMSSFFSDITSSMIAIKNVTKCSRVNIAILGNAESHIHAHLVPRYSDSEEFPNKSPWNDPRPASLLKDFERQNLIGDINKRLIERS